MTAYIEKAFDSLDDTFLVSVLEKVDFKKLLCGIVTISGLMVFAKFAGKSHYFSFCWENWKAISFFIMRCWKTGISGVF